MYLCIYVSIIFVFIFYLYLTSQTIKVELPFVAFIYFAFFTRNNSVWINIAFLTFRLFTTERQYPSHRMGSEDDK